MFIRAYSYGNTHNGPYNQKLAVVVQCTNTLYSCPINLDVMFKESASPANIPYDAGNTAGYLYYAVGGVGGILVLLALWRLCKAASNAASNAATKTSDSYMKV
jgi:hypothetical protein